MNFKLILMAQDAYLFDAFSYHFRPNGRFCKSAPRV